MRGHAQDIINLINAKQGLIWVNSYEEERVIRDVLILAQQDAKASNISFYDWSKSKGMDRLILNPKNRVLRDNKDTKNTASPNAVLNFLHAEIDKNPKEATPTALVLKDFDVFLKNEDIYRTIRDILEMKNHNSVPIIILTNTLEVPDRLDRLTHTIQYDLPTDAFVKTLYQGVNKQMAAKEDTHALTAEQVDALVVASRGLTFREIENFVSISIVESRTLDISVLHKKKLEMIERSGVLEYKETCAKMDQIGGNHAFKQWVKSLRHTFSDEAKDFGLSRPKGYLALGIPGTSKTYAAEAIAGDMNLPMITFSLSKIMDKRVGESEQRAQNAFRIIKANAPCLLLIDEVEKEIGGVSSSNATDGGTVSRIFSQLLKFLNDNDNVFVVMTSNDVSKLPSELTRSGRLDTKWYFGLPNFDERAQIARIHLDNQGKAYSEELVSIMADNTKGFTGAEIKATVISMMTHLFNDFLETGNTSFTVDHFTKAVSSIVPISKSSRETINALEDWAKDRALNASGDAQEVDVVPEDEIKIELF